jgi:HK97 family phage prohead protease
LSLQYKSFDLAFKSLDDAGGFSAYFAVFGNVDRQGDVIEPGAFSNIDEFTNDGWIALSHDAKALAVAYPVKAVQDETGLLVTGVFHSTAEAQACRTVVKERLAAGKGVKGSIGYTIEDSTLESQDGKTVQRISKLNVFECSFVNLPANPLAEAQEVKSVATATKEKVISLDDFKNLFELKLKGGPMEEDAYDKCMKACDDMEEHGRKCVKMARKFRKDLEPHDPHTGEKEEDSDEDGANRDRGRAAQDKPDSDKDDEEENEKSRRALRLKALRSKVRVARP